MSPMGGGTLTTDACGVGRDIRRKSQDASFRKFRRRFADVSFRGVRSTYTRFVRASACLLFHIFRAPSLSRKFRAIAGVATPITYMFRARFAGVAQPITQWIL